jgi:threonine aldolase
MRARAPAAEQNATFWIVLGGYTEPGTTMATTLSEPRQAELDSALRLDFRSDTITHPTAEMREAMASAPVGDDVFGEDPTINALEVEAARILGKAAGLFVASGTQGNLLASLTLTRPGDEVIAEASSHIANSEVGGAARLGGLTVRAIPGRLGKISPEQIAATVRPENVHYAHTTLLAIENTHNSAGGTIWTLDELDAAIDAARSRGLRVHIDGARIFNAAVGLGVPPARLARDADTLTFCLSKGLSAPVGSVLVGSEDTIAEARRYRKMVGGGMRQAGVIAAAGLVALRISIQRLAEDHRRARRLAEGLAQIDGIQLDLATVQSNIVRFDVGGLGHSTSSFAEAMRAAGVGVSGGAGPSGVRMVTHRHIDDDSVEKALAAAQSARRGASAGIGRAIYG